MDFSRVELLTPCVKDGRRPVVTAAKAAAVRAVYLGGQSIADLLPEHTAVDQDATAPELSVVLDIPGKVAYFLRAADLEPSERAALDHSQVVRRGTG